MWIPKKKSNNRARRIQSQQNNSLIIDISKVITLSGNLCVNIKSCNWIFIKYVSKLVTYVIDKMYLSSNFLAFAFAFYFLHKHKVRMLSLKRPWMSWCSPKHQAKNNACCLSLPNFLCCTAVRKFPSYFPSQPWRNAEGSFAQAKGSCALCRLSHK